MPYVHAHVGVREYIVLSARVHPGESNSSWVMRGTLHVYALYIYNVCVYAYYNTLLYKCILFAHTYMYMHVYLNMYVRHFF